MGLFNRMFGNAKAAPSSGKPQFSHASSPQYAAGVEPAGSAMQDGFKGPYSGVPNGPSANPPMFVRPNHAAVVTTGFDDSDSQAWYISYGHRQQPDVGGALNYAYESYELPLVNAAGAFMVAQTPFKPFGALPLQAWPVSVQTGAGLIPGQVISQPLLNPQGPDSGFDIYN